MKILKAIRRTVDEYRWEHLLSQIIAQPTRKWRPLPKFSWPHEIDDILRTGRFAIAHYYRVHRHPDPFLGDWQRYHLPQGWTHAGADPEHLIGTYRDHANYGFLTEFESCRSDLWCGDYGIERREHRCVHQLPRVAEFAAQIAILRRYLRGYGDLAVHEYFHEVPVSLRSHPPTTRWVFREFGNTFQITELSPIEIRKFGDWGGQLTSSIVSFHAVSSSARETLDPACHYDQSSQAMVAGHPVEVFYAYLLLGMTSQSALARWVNLCETSSFPLALTELKASPTRASTLPQGSVNWSWFELIDLYADALDLHARRLASIHPDAKNRLVNALSLGAVEILKRSNPRELSKTNPQFLSVLKWQVDDFATEGRIPSAYMPRHFWK